MSWCGLLYCHSNCATVLISLPIAKALAVRLIGARSPYARFKLQIVSEIWPINASIRFTVIVFDTHFIKAV